LLFPYLHLRLSTELTAAAADSVSRHAHEIAALLFLPLLPRPLPFPSSLFPSSFFGGTNFSQSEKKNKEYPGLLDGR
jgi:hypothetical protein